MLLRLRTPLAAAALLALAWVPHGPQRPDAGETERDFPSEYFFIQRALPDGTLPSARIAEATEQLRFERALRSRTLAASSASDWVPVGPYGIGGRVNAVVAAPGGVPAYLGSANGGVWRSNDLGVHWTPVSDAPGLSSIGALALDPNDPLRLWCGTGDANGTVDGYDGTGLYLSRDGGTTWFERGLRETSHIAAVAPDPSDTGRVYVAAMGKAFTTDPNRGLYRTMNGGKTWERTLFVNDSTGASEVVVNPVHPESVYCVTWERVRRLTYRRAAGPGCAVWRSVDGGSTWAPIVNGLPPAGDNLGRITIALAPSRPSRVYASVVSGATSGYVGLGVFRSDDGGDSWQRVDTGLAHRNAFGGFGWYFGHMAVSATDPDEIWVCGVRLLHSTDGGVTLLDVTGNAHVDQHGLWQDPSDPTRVFVGNDGGFWWRSGTLGAWQASADLPITQFYAGAVAPQNAAKVFGGAQDNGTSRTLSGPTSWIQVLGADGMHVLVSPADSNVVFAEWQYCADRSGVKRSITGGNNFSSTTGWSSGDRYNWNTPFVVDPTNPDIMLSGSHRVYKSTNNGVAWAPISGDLTTNPGAAVVYGTISTVAISKADPSLYLAGTDDGRVWRSQDSGTNWQEITAGLPPLYVTRVVADPGDPQVIYVAHSGFGQDLNIPRVFRSVNRGTTWQDISGNLYDAPVNDLVVDPDRPGTLYAGTDLGVFETRDLGATWVPLGGAMPVQPVWDLELHQASRQLFAFTHGRSAWKLDLSTVPLDVPPAVASGLALSAPAPNPARGPVSLSLTLGSRAQVQVSVFDAGGRRVRLLLRDALDPGPHALAWDARDERGGRVAPGVYFVHARAGDGASTRRVVIADAP